MRPNHRAPRNLEGERETGSTNKRTGAAHLPFCIHEAELRTALERLEANYTQGVGGTSLGLSITCSLGESQVTSALGLRTCSCSSILCNNSLIAASINLYFFAPATSGAASELFKPFF